MKRRKFIIGTGGAAAGGAMLLGSGAFTSVTAERDVDVSVEGDADAYLGLEVLNDAYASKEGDGILALSFDEDSGADGDGFNPNSTTRIDDIFSIANQGTQDVGVSIEKGDLEDGVEEFDFLAKTATDEESLVYDAPVVLETGESFDVSVEVEVTSSEPIDGVIEDDEVTIVADEDDEDDGVVLQPVAVGDQTFDTIQAGVDAAEPGDTVEVNEGTYDEQVTIDVDDVTLEAAEGASPTVTQDGEIPVLVDGVDNVEVDDENINFESGIDVGHDFSDYDPGITSEDADAIVTDDATEDDEYESIGAALEEEGADTTILVKSDYDSSNEDSDNAGSSSALISIVDENVEVISEAGPEATVIDERPDAVGDGRAVDINAANVVFQGFDVADAAQEGIIVTGVEDAEGIEITDNKVTSSNDGILVSEFGPEGFDSASTDGILIENNEVNHERLGISLSDGADDPIVENNTITGTNDASGSGERGIQLSDGGVSEASISGNLVETSVVGFQRNAEGDSVDELTNNHFIDNTWLAIANSETGELKADRNWFGTEDRQSIQDDDPTGDPPFPDTQVSGDVNIDPFAGAPIDPDAGDDD